MAENGVFMLVQHRGEQEYSTSPPVS